MFLCYFIECVNFRAINRRFESRNLPGGRSVRITAGPTGLFFLVQHEFISLHKTNNTIQCSLWTHMFLRVPELGQITMTISVTIKLEKKEHLFGQVSTADRFWYSGNICRRSRLVLILFGWLTAAKYLTKTWFKRCHVKHVNEKIYHEICVRYRCGYRHGVVEKLVNRNVNFLESIGAGVLPDHVRNFRQDEHEGDDKHHLCDLPLLVPLAYRCSCGGHFPSRPPLSVQMLGHEARQNEDHNSQDDGGEGPFDRDIECIKERLSSRCSCADYARALQNRTVCVQNVDGQNCWQDQINAD